jgi:D-alanyl-D-alanine carboxypeptidase/D-alanyl-D-alanine-endopeptidase (penicillin-binding protein 4)
MNRTRAAILALALGAASPAFAQQTLQQRVDSRLAEAGPGVRFGLVVADEKGGEIVAVNPDGRFIPASNTKMFTTAAAFATLPAIDQPDTIGGASVRIEGRDVVLKGHGDARLSSAADCTADCLATLADAVAAKTRVVRDVIGDDSLFPDQRWGPGMSWNNIPSSSGTAASALTLDDNELVLTVTPDRVDMPPALAGRLYYDVVNEARTVPGDADTLGYAREPNKRLLRITGTIGAAAKPRVMHFGIDDPADYAATRFAEMLHDRGVKVTGRVRAVHRPLSPGDDPEIRKGTPAARPPQAEPLARLTPAPLIEDLTHTNKVSQNLHAELFLRRVATQQGSGSIADGVAVVEGMLAGAGVPRRAYDFSDGSGMSSYNRVAPRAVVTFLRWIATQPWGTAWRGTLPIAGTDGTLARRFKGTPLEGRLFAKTGTLNATNALSGYMIARSGKTLTFSAYANDVPDGVSATTAMDAALAMIAAEN